MALNAFINWFHLLAVVVWLGGLVYTLGIISPLTRPENGLPKAFFVESAMRFRPYVWAAMAISVLSGLFRIQNAGGMSQLPVLIHAKIGIAVLMMLLGLMSTVYFLPKLQESLQLESPSAEQLKQGQLCYKGYLVFSGCILFLGAIVLFLLALSGLI